MAREYNIATETHGRYLVETGASANVMLVGFHGYAETAEMEMQRLQSIEGSSGWTLVAVQALHPFYRRKENDVVASWMTRQDRELAITDNTAYVRRVIHRVEHVYGLHKTVVFSGFSQGVAMAYRAACALDRASARVIALAGDIPPELDTVALSRMASVLIGRGTREEWYSREKVRSDETRLQAAGVSAQVVEFDGGHEWTADFRIAVAKFLSDVVQRASRQPFTPPPD